MFCKTLGTMCPINLNVKKNRAYINVFTTYYMQVFGAVPYTATVRGTGIIKYQVREVRSVPAPIVGCNKQCHRPQQYYRTQV